MPKHLGGMQRVLADWERTALSAGLTIVAFVADWLLARRLAHDRAQAGQASATRD